MIIFLIFEKRVLAKKEHHFKNSKLTILEVGCHYRRKSLFLWWSRVQENSTNDQSTTKGKHQRNSVIEQENRQDR